MIRWDDRVYLYWVLLLLLLPLQWLLAMAIAAAFHELCHMAVVYAVGGRVISLKVRPFGAVMEVEGISGLKEGFCALAGPVGSFLLVFLIRFLPMLGICGLVQGLFNLLPVYPLDGGRILRVLLRKRP